MGQSRARKLRFEQFESRLLLAAGDLDPSFGTDGIVETRVETSMSSEDEVVATAKDADGRILVAGRTKLGGQTVGIVARYMQDGSLDASFGDSGIATIAWSGAGDFIDDLAVHSDGRIIVSGSTDAFHHDGHLAVWSLAADGQLDRSFGTDGFAETGIGRYASGHSVVVSPQGRILVHSRGDYPQHTGQVLVVALTSTGRLDSTFSQGGVAAIPALEQVGDLVTLEDGSVVIAARTARPENAVYLVKLLPAGNIDTSFGSNGYLHITAGPGYVFDDNAPLILDVDSAGNLVLASKWKGSNSTSAYAEFSFTKLKPNGAIDSGFGTQGHAAIAFDRYGARQLVAAKVLADDSIQFVGIVSDSGRYDERQLGIGRITKEGALDSRFGFHGVLRSDFGLNLADSRAERGAIVETSGGVFAFAFTRLNGPTGFLESALRHGDFGLLGFLRDGRLADSFGDNGLAVVDVFDSDVNTVGRTSLAVDGDQTLQLIENRVEQTLVLAKYGANGDFDPSFGIAGVVPLEIPNSSPGPWPLATILRRGPDFLVIASQGENTWIGKFATDGVLDTSYGANGWATFHHFDHFYDHFLFTSTSLPYPNPPLAVASQSDNRLLLVGQIRDAVNDTYYYEVVRLQENGLLDTTFNGQGYLRVPKERGTLAGDAGSLCVQDNDGFYALLSNTTGELFGVSLGRFSAEGTRDSSFGAGGEVSTPLEVGGGDMPLFVSCSGAGGVLVAGSDLVDNRLGYVRPIVASYLQDGSPSMAFGNGGQARFAVGLESDTVRDIGVTDDGQILVATDSRFGGEIDVVLTRLQPNGAADLSFGLLGSQRIDLHGFGESLTNINISAGDVTLSGSASHGTETRAFVARVLGDSPWLNRKNSRDVNDDDHVSPADALLIVNELNRNGPRQLPRHRQTNTGSPYFDVNGDRAISPVDVLIIVNAINSRTLAEGELPASQLFPPTRIANLRANANNDSTDWVAWMKGSRESNRDAKIPRNLAAPVEDSVAPLRRRALAVQASQIRDHLFGDEDLLRNALLSAQR